MTAFLIATDIGYSRAADRNWSKADLPSSMIASSSTKLAFVMCRTSQTY